MTDWAVPETDARTVPASLRPRTTDEPWVEPAPAANENLAGENDRRDAAVADPTYDFPQVDEANASNNAAAQDDANKDAPRY
jgi:hypothetical protein